MIVIPPEILSHHKLQKTEFLIEDQIENLLNESSLPDDQKVKLLSEMIKRYHRIVHIPPKPIPVTMKPDKDNEDSSTIKLPEVINNRESKQDPVINQIEISVPPSYKKFIPEILSSMKKINYNWTENGELIIDNKVIPYTHVADLLSYIARNRKDDTTPIGFGEFWGGLKKANIPNEFINRKTLKKQVHSLSSDRTKRFKRSSSDPQYFSEGEYSRLNETERPHSETPNLKWLNY